MIARRLQTKSFELRAIMSLSRPCQWRSTYEDALRLLPEVYGWSTEGFDTPDLHDAPNQLTIRRCCISASTIPTACQRTIGDSSLSRRSMLPVVNYYLTPAWVEWPAVVCPAPTAG